MPVSDISEVTRAIIAILNQAMIAQMATPLPVVADLPMRTNMDCVSFYLYHVAESGHYKNVVPPGRSDHPPVKYTPMGLNLFYQLTANVERTDGEAAFDEQVVMSIAMKSLHDNPFVSSLGDDNHFRISIQPVPATDAVHNWTAGPSAIKLSAYYEVATIFLEPERSKSYAGRVLTYGNYIFTEKAPRIAGSLSNVQYTLPGDPTTRQVKVQPGQSPFGGNIYFTGSGFNSGSLSMRIHHSLLKGNTAIADASWGISIPATGELIVVIGKTAFLENDNSQVTLLPGLYTMEIISTRVLELPNGQMKELKNSSNEFPFIISPSINAVSAVVSNEFTVTGYLFQHADLKEEQIDVYIGEERLNKMAGAILVAGEYDITAPDSMDISLPDSSVPGTDMPLRILIRGAESLPPTWIHIP